MATFIIFYTILVTMRDLIVVTYRTTVDSHYLEPRLSRIPRYLEL